MSYRLLVLGSGPTGSEFIRNMLTHYDVDSIVLADIDESGAARVAHSVQDPRLQVTPVDVRNVADVARLAQGCDLVMCALPGSLFPQAFEAACQAKVDYVGLYAHTLPHHEDQARAAGIAAMPNLGVSPGIVNVLGRVGAGLLDEPREIHFSHASSQMTTETRAMLALATTYAGRPTDPALTYFQNGRHVPMAPFDLSTVVDFGSPLGELRVYGMPHSQTKTFPKHFPTLEHVCVRATWRPEAMEHLAILRHYGLLDDVEVTATSGTANIRDLVTERVWQTHGGQDDMGPSYFFCHVEVSGILHGRAAKAVLRLGHDRQFALAAPSAVAGLTGIGSSIGAMQLMRSRRERVGILDQEDFGDPAEFIEELSGRTGVTLTRDLEVEEHARDTRAQSTGRPSRCGEPLSSGGAA